MKFWKFPDIAPLLYANRPNPNERRELRCSFIFTKDNLKVLEHSANKIGDKAADHWAISSQLSTTAPDKGELNIYEKHNLDKLEKTMAGRSARPSLRNLSSRLEVCSLQDTLSTASTEISSSGGREAEATSLTREDREGKYLTQPTFSNLIDKNA